MGIYGPVAIAQPLSVDDNAASLTVDGIFFQSTQPVSAVTLPLPTGAATLAGQTQPGVDVGDVTVNNLTGAAAVNIQDGGNSITVDGTVTANQGTAAGASSGWPHKLVDSAGVNVATVKAASTAIASTDLPLAVGLHPTSPLPAGTNVLGALSANQSVNNAQWIGSAAPTVGQKAMASSIPVVLASDQSVLPALAEGRASTLWITATAAVNTASTATLPAAGVGLFHYITRVELVKLYSVVGIAAGAGVIITTTNLPGTPAFTTEQLASAAGTAIKVIDWTPATPFKSTTANTSTTFVAPLQLQTIWRWNVSYFTAA